MRKLILLVTLVLLVAMPMCGRFEKCLLDSDCADGNPCTKDVCKWVPAVYVEDLPWWCDSTSNYCTYRDIDDGTPCEVDEGSGVCDAGACRLDGEIPDGGV